MSKLSYLVKSTGKLYNIRRLDQLFSRHPFAADQLVRLDKLEQRYVNECELALEISQ